MPILLKRAYEPASAEDGLRYLVDRLWPRGVSAKKLRLTAWRKELSPSTELRRWYHHDPSLYPEFRRRYLDELKIHAAALETIRAEAAHQNVTLVFSAREVVRSNAWVLSELLREGPGGNAGATASMARERGASSRAARTGTRGRARSTARWPLRADPCRTPSHA